MKNIKWSRKVNNTGVHEHRGEDTSKQYPAKKSQILPFPYGVKWMVIRGWWGKAQDQAEW